MPRLEGPAYVWGYNSKSATTGAEWILVTNRSWILPSSASGIALPLQWSMGTATDVILGSVNASAGVHMQTAAVGNSGSAHHAWLASFGLGRVDDTQVWELDSDLDGESNLSEYAAGTDPTNSASVSRAAVQFYTNGEERVITLTFDKNPEARVHYQIELSSDLNHWEPGNEQIDLVSEEADKLIFRDIVPAHSSRPTFYRLNVALIP